MDKHLAISKSKDKLFRLTALGLTVFALLVLLVLLADIFWRGFGRLNWGFFNNLPSRHWENAGILTAIAGMLSLLFFTIIIALPIGILAGV